MSRNHLFVFGAWIHPYVRFQTLIHSNWYYTRTLKRFHYRNSPKIGLICISAPLCPQDIVTIKLIWRRNPLENVKAKWRLILKINNELSTLMYTINTISPWYKTGKSLDGTAVVFDIDYSILTANGPWVE